MTLLIDTASPDDSTELSFKKGEVLEILTKSEQWWEARKLDGTKGSETPCYLTLSSVLILDLVAPSNYLKEITSKVTVAETAPVTSTQAMEPALQEAYPYKAEALYACMSITCLL